MPKILIVDDDIQASGLLERVVRMFNHEAAVVNQSTLAMDTAHSFLPDLIILDLMMPDLNGFELCVLLRADPGFVKTPVIVVSAMEDKEAKEKAFSVGVNEYLMKPFNLTELREKIDTLLANGHLQTILA
jgi:two-component system phosphate regulon response regulator PhoB